MQSYQLAFIQDLKEGARDLTMPGIWRTSSGISCTHVFLCAALIERTSLSGGGLHLRIADPTGACSGQTPVHAGHLNEMIAGLPVPSFVSCAASVQSRPGAAEGEPVLHIEWMQEVPRRARDRWILSTAQRTLTSLELGNDSRPGTACTLLGAIEQALASVDPAECACAPPDQAHLDAVLDAITSASEGRLGADREKVMEILSGMGISDTGAKACISHLIEEGDCYCPQPGRLRCL